MLHHCRTLVNVLRDLLLHLLLHLVCDAFAVFDAHLDDLECVAEQATLDSLINLCVGAERWSVVNFKHPGLEFLIEHDIETEQFKAAIRLLSLTATINVLELWLNSDDCFDNYGLNLIPNLRRSFRCTWFSFLCRWLSHYPFETVVESELVSIVVEIVILLVKRVISQVCVRIVEVFRRVVLLRCQSHQAVLVEKDGHGVDHGRHQHVDPKVVLVPLPERGLIQILLDHVARLALLKCLHVLLSDSPTAIMIHHITTIVVGIVGAERGTIVPGSIRERVHVVVLLLLLEVLLVVSLVLPRVSVNLLLHLIKV